ncbi:MAG: hypothetical protein WCQ47_06455 [bacterium]
MKNFVLLLSLLVFSELLFGQNSLQNMYQVPEMKRDTFSQYDTNRKNLADSIDYKMKKNERLKKEELEVQKTPNKVALTGEFDQNRLKAIFYIGSKCTDKNFIDKNDADTLRKVSSIADDKRLGEKALALTYLGCYSKQDMSITRFLYDTASNNKNKDEARVAAVRGLELSESFDSTNYLIKLNQIINKSFSFNDVNTVDLLSSDARVEAESLLSIGNKAFTGKKEQSARQYLVDTMKASNSRAAGSSSIHRLSKWYATIILGQNGDPLAGEYLANIATSSDYLKNTEGELALRQDARSIVYEKYLYLVRDEMNKNGSVIRTINGRPDLLAIVKANYENDKTTTEGMIFIASWFILDLGYVRYLAEWGPVAKALSKLKRLYSVERTSTQAVELGRASELLSGAKNFKYEKWIKGLDKTQTQALNNTLSKYGLKMDEGLQDALVDAHLAGGNIPTSGLTGAQKVEKLREFSNLKTYLIQNRGLTEAEAKDFIYTLADEKLKILGSFGETELIEDLAGQAYGSTKEFKALELYPDAYQAEAVKELLTYDKAIKEFLDKTGRLDDFLKSSDFTTMTDPQKIHYITTKRFDIARKVSDANFHVSRAETIGGVQYYRLFDARNFRQYTNSLTQQISASEGGALKLLDEAEAVIGK